MGRDRRPLPADDKGAGRRAILAGVISVPALALPAVAVAVPAAAPPAITSSPASVAASDPDPIFAALAKHRRLKREWYSLSAELEEAEGTIGRKPSELITWRNYTICDGELKDARDRFLGEGANAEQIEIEYRKAKADLRANKRALREWYKRHGLADLKAKFEDTLAASNVARWELTKTRPTTVAGCGALVACVRSDMKIGHHPWQERALENAVRALLDLPNGALPFAPESKDLDLANAVFATQNANSRIDRLQERHGDDADGRDDYQKCEDERDQALDTLASVRARTSNGLVAKAEALTTEKS